MSDRSQSTSFIDRAERLLSRLESALDPLADDLDIDLQRAGNVITLSFDNGHRIIINIQEAAQEMWVAARSGGFHFRCREDDGRWYDTRSNEDFNNVLSKLIGAETEANPVLAL
jgi:CyaY protein